MYKLNKRHAESGNKSAETARNNKKGERSGCAENETTVRAATLRSAEKSIGNEQARRQAKVDERKRGPSVA
jgi:hypothetical protein